MTGDRLRRWGRRVALGLTLAIALGGWPGCRSGEERVLPPQLFGTWTTTAPRYRGRSMEIHAASVVLAEGGHPIDRYRIEGVRRRRGTEGEIYQLRCVTEDGLPDALRLTYVADAPPYMIVGQAPARWLRRRGR